jgi:hypothetical protein
MSIVASFIQVNIRGLFNGQQFQISPTYGVTDADGVDVQAGNFSFIESSLRDWLVAWWNGWGALPTNGISDRLANILPETAVVTEVLAVARTALMELPLQATITGELNGTRGGAGDVTTSWVAASCRARSTVWGRKGASFRAPFLNKGDMLGNEVTEATRSLIQTDFLDLLTEQGTAAAIEAGLLINTALGEILNVFAMRPVAVTRVADPVTGNPTFPYVGPGAISAVVCQPWTININAGSQNTRKPGSGL